MCVATTKLQKSKPESSEGGSFRRATSRHQFSPTPPETEGHQRPLPLASFEKPAGCSQESSPCHRATPPTHGRWQLLPMSYAKAALRAHAAEQEEARGNSSPPHAQLVLPRTDKYGNPLPPTLTGNYRWVISPWSKVSDVAQQREGEKRDHHAYCQTMVPPPPPPPPPSPPTSAAPAQAASSRPSSSAQARSGRS